ncbi:DedA family protein [Streptomyces sp. AP-93]|uniref:DedA family protein n=1 Tax=Streptomyces sp. AP-93 TaxID=2929048 RepID=UPI001FAE7D87|nr:DedA family protein [Streptomyces sp. AP-93]MCJ0871775.1 DedA family protein [Streptomyces sp. AP-93]
MTTWFADHALVLGSWGVLAMVLLLPALEAAIPLIGMLMPGQTAVVAGGMLAYHQQVPLSATMVAALVGAVLGNTAGYLAGRRWEHRLLDRMPRRLLKPRHTAKALALVERHGGRAILIGRFTAGLRTLVPTLCGISGIPLRRYLLWSVLSCALWAPTFVLIGFAIGGGGPL